MAPNQHVEATGDLQPGTGRLRVAATRILGERAARSLAARKTDLDAALRHTFAPSGRQDARRLRSFRDAHHGERCVIIGNGPSLKNTDMSLLRNEWTFGLNRIYLMFDEIGFRTSFHVVVNQLVVEQCADDFRSILGPLFTTTPSRKFLDGSDALYLDKLVGPRFSTNVAHGIWEGATVTFVAMQLAYFMGFSDVCLVGVDHKFAVSGPAHQVVESRGDDSSHFDPRYFGTGFKWQLPDLETSEIAYSLARSAFEREGRRIVDATVGGHLAVFPKVALEEFLARDRS